MEKKKNYRKQIYIGVSMLCMVVAMMFFVFHAAANDNRRKTIKIPSYSESARDELIEEQRAKGFLYAGMTTVEDDYSREAGVKNPKVGETYYAKFIPEEILTIKAQVSEKIINEEELNVDEKSSIRFVTAIDSLEYRYLGFRIQRGDGAVSNKQTTANVYAKLRAMVETKDGEQWLDYTPEQVFDHEDANYFKIWTINNVPQNHFNTDITVRPYYVTFDNVEVIGTTGIKTVNLGRSWVYVDDYTTGIQPEKYDTSTYADLQDETQLGTFNAPFKDIQTAVDYMNKINPTKTVEPVILVKNLVTDSTNDDEDVYESYKISKDINITRTLTLTSANPKASVNEPDVNHLSTVKMDAEIQNGMFVVKNGITSNIATTVRVKAITLDGGSSQTAENVRAAWVGEGATLKLGSHATIKNFNSTYSGGGVFVKGTLAVNGGTITANKSAADGGNVFIGSGGSLNMDAGEISAGSAFTSGGNISAVGELLKTSTIAITGGKVSAGTVTGISTEEANNVGVGGNIYIDYGRLEVTNARIEKGESTQSRGGNIYIRRQTTVDLNEGTIVELGSAPINGGNIMADTRDGIELNIKNATVQNGTTANGDGGNIRMGRGTLTITNGNILNGTAYKGGNIYVDSGATISADTDTEIGNGTATYGGNLYFNKSTTIGDEEIYGGNATNGGNVYVAEGVTLTVDGNGINNGELHPSVTNGGHIYTNGTVILKTGVTLSGGEATTGGNIYVNGTGSLQMNSGSEITEGRSTTGNGGNIYLNTNSNFVMDETAKVADGEAQNNGGNIYTCISLSIKDHEISGGTAQSNGGNIYAANNTTLTLSGEGITEGSATGNGGNVYSIGTVVMQNGAVLTGGNANNGGNIGLGVTGALEMAAGSQVSSGSATVGGGNIYAMGNENRETTKKPAITIDGSSVTDGTAGKENDPETGYGGNIYAKYATVIIQNQATVSGGSAGRSGGNIHAIGCDGADANGYINAYGVAVSITGESTVSGGTVISELGTNEVGVGGNIFMTYGTLDVVNSTIKEGKSLHSRGGNVYIRYGATLNLTEGSEIVDGTAKKHGGNIMAELNSNININNATVSDGTAETGSGGNIRIGIGTLTLNGGIITRGTAATEGGNIDAGGRLVDGKVADNNITSVVIKDGTISEGSALVSEADDVAAKGNGRGGNINIKYGNFTMKKGTIELGKATARGGNISIQGHESKAAEVSITGGTISGGEATSQVPDSNYHGIAGNLYVEYGDIEVTNATIKEGNASSRGGNIYIRRHSTLNLNEGSEVLDGTAGCNGGNMMAEKKSTVNISGGKITRGTATEGEGGNIKLTVGTLKLVSGSITNGTAQKGGNIYADGAIVWGTVDSEGSVGGEGDVEEDIDSVTDGSGEDVNSTPDGSDTGNNDTNTSETVTIQHGVEVTIEDGTISGGKALGNTDGMGGNIYFKAGTLTIEQGTIDGAVTEQDNPEVLAQNEPEYIAQNGGNIYAIGGTLNGTTQHEEVHIIFKSGVIQNGSTSNIGGNVFVKEGTFNMIDGKILSGNAAKYGGGIYIGEAGNFIMTDGSIEGNTAGDFGGNIYAAGIINTDNSETPSYSYIYPTIKINGGTISGELSTSEGDVITQNAKRGGNIYMQGVQFEMTDGTIMKGDASTSGGNIHAEARKSENSENVYQSTLVITKGIISEGRATNSDDGKGGNVCIDTSTLTSGNTVEGQEEPQIQIISGTARDGGNIYAYQSTLNLNKNSLVNLGQATNEGGNIVASHTDINVDGALVQNGVALGSSGSGGNIRMIETGKLTLTSGNILNGTAKNGGNVYLSYGNEMEMLAGVIEGGKAQVTSGETPTYGNGGNIYAGSNEAGTGARITLSGGSINSNAEMVTADKGGNIFISCGTLNISDGVEIVGGRVYNDGGNIYAGGNSTLGLGSTINMTGGTISGGITFAGEEDDNIYNAQNGGNIYMSHGTLNMSGNATITGGRAYLQGGNIWATGKISNDTNTCNIVMTSGSITLGKATRNVDSNTEGIGGNIYMNNSTLNVGTENVVAKAIISGGRSLHSRGGNIYMHNTSILNLNASGIIEDGFSKKNGGNVMVNNTGIINIVGGTIQEGVSEDAQGGNIRLGASGKLIINGGTIADGRSKGTGANVFVEAGAFVELQGGKILVQGGQRIENQTASNFYINVDTNDTSKTKLIAITGELDSESSIGVERADVDTVFAECLNADKTVATYTPFLTWFVSDVSGKTIFLDETTKQFSFVAQ